MKNLKMSVKLFWGFGLVNILALVIGILLWNWFSNLDAVIGEDALMSAREQKVGQGHNARQRMLEYGKSKPDNKNSADAAPWGGSIAGTHMPEPVIDLNDRDFGKY